MYFIKNEGLKFYRVYIILSSTWRSIFIVKYGRLLIYLYEYIGNSTGLRHFYLRLLVLGGCPDRNFQCVTEEEKHLPYLQYTLQ
jgi:hypothetical protein